MIRTWVIEIIVNKSTFTFRSLIYIKSFNIIFHIEPSNIVLKSYCMNAVM